MYYLCMCQNFWKVNKSWRQKISKSHCVYPPEIIQTSSLGSLHKKSLEHNNCLYVASVLQQRVRKPLTDNIPTPQNHFQTNLRGIMPMRLKNTGTTMGQFV